MDLFSPFHFFVRKKHTALCLNSAFFGFYAHAGFIKGLDQIGFVPTKITGCSSGAMIGALVAAGVPAAKIEETILSLKKSDFWEGNFLTNWTKPFRKGIKNYSGVLSGRKVRRLLEPFLGKKNINELPIPLGLSVSNLTQKKRELLTEGNLLEAVIYSMTFPLLFEIQSSEKGHEYIDGGVVDQEPIKELIMDPSVDRILIHSIDNGVSDSQNKLLRAFGSSLQIIENETRELKELLAKQYNKKILRLVTKTPFIHQNSLDLGYLAFDFGRSTALHHKSVILDRMDGF